jgi:5-methyltetrahydropteroyltriglutamate--homocysteine methyltransferase
MERVMMFQDETDEGFVKIAEMHLAAINKACEAFRATAGGCTSAGATGKARTSTTSRSSKVLPVFYQATAGALRSSSPIRATSTNTRRSSSIRSPKDKILIPGVIESTSNFVEQPEVVARRIEEAVAAIGDRERVIASTDCGFGTVRGARMGRGVIVWPEAQDDARGSRPCVQRLWGKKVA